MKCLKMTKISWAKKRTFQCKVRMSSINRKTLVNRVKMIKSLQGTIILITRAMKVKLKASPYIKLDPSLKSNSRTSTYPSNSLNKYSSSNHTRIYSWSIGTAPAAKATKPSNG